MSSNLSKQVNSSGGAEQIFHNELTYDIKNGINSVLPAQIVIEESDKDFERACW